MSVPVRIGNCSGFYGDRIAAAREMVEGGPIDVLCGDYLAELTMLILAKAQARDAQEQKGPAKSGELPLDPAGARLDLDRMLEGKVVHHHDLVDWGPGRR